MSERLTQSFTLDEFLGSQTAIRRGIPNTPDAASLATIRQVLAPGMQRVRDLLDVPIFITSGYRSPVLNRAVGGSRTSQHVSGNAADFQAPGFGTPLEVCRFLLDNQALIGFDQLIEEGTWVHISFVSGAPRGQVLTAYFENGGVRYEQGLRS